MCSLSRRHWRATAVPCTFKRGDIGAGYKTLASNLKPFVEIGSLPLPAALDALVEGSAVENTLFRHKACRHKCSSKFHVTKLKRPQKRSTDSTESTGEIRPKRTRASVQCAASKSTCFFCEDLDPKIPFIVSALSV